MGAPCSLLLGSRRHRRARPVTGARVIHALKSVNPAGPGQLCCHLPSAFRKEHFPGIGVSLQQHCQLLSTSSKRTRVSCLQSMCTLSPPALLGPWSLFLATGLSQAPCSRARVPSRRRSFPQEILLEVPHHPVITPRTCLLLCAIGLGLHRPCVGM